MRRILMIGAAALAVGALGACSARTGSSGDYGAGDLAAPNRAAQGAAAAAPAEGSTAGSGSGGSTSGRADSSPVLLGEARIRTAELTVSVTGARNVAPTADRAGDIALRAGGEIDGDERTSGRYASATLRLRVPPDQLQDSLRALAKLGTAKSRHLTSRDVTEQVADVKSRTASAAQAIARLRGLYGDATKIEDVIAIESELSTREADLESLQAQQRALASQTGLASITVHLQTARKSGTPPPAKDDRSGFLGGLADGWDAFTSAAAKVATGVGAALPFLVLLVLVGVGLRWAWPRLRPARVTRPIPGPAPSE